MAALLVTGAAGSVGYRVCEALRTDEANRVVGLDLKPFRRPLDGVELVTLDLRYDDLADAFSGIDTVVHLASAFDPQRDGLESAGVDLDATRRLLDAVTAAGVTNLVVLSSAMVYGAWPDNPVPITEERALRPNSSFSFARSKVEVERLATDWHQQSPGTRLAILRPAVALAEGQISWVARILRAAAVIEVAEQDPPLQFLHTDDLAAAVVLAATADLSGPYNVAPDGSVDGDACRSLGGKTPRLRLPEEQADRLAAMGWRYRLSPTPPGMMPYCMYPWVIANDRLRAAGWEPTHTNEEAYVAGTPPKPWAVMNAKRRQNLALGGAAVVGSGLAAAAAVAVRRFRG